MKVANVFVVEPYLSGSHQSWAEGYAASSRHDVDLLSLPGRFWKWRMFGGSLSLAHEAIAHAAAARPDVVLASDMLDLPAFLGHAGTALGDPKTVLYMHENQLTYPLSPTARDDLAYAYMNWSSMVRADEVWFNSGFHLDSVFSALPGFLKHFPDFRHTSMVDEVRQKSSVVPVGVDLSWVSDQAKTEPPLVIWNQRWEYDKNPARMLGALSRLIDSGAAFRLAICGENFRNTPDEFTAAREILDPFLIQYGWAEPARYRCLLNEASVVISTAEHEFFGVAAVEAMAAGAIPVFPDRLSYPELIPEPAHERTLYDSDAGLDALLRGAVSDSERRTELRELIAPAMARFSWDVQGPEYDDALLRPSPHRQHEHRVGPEET